MMMLKMTLKMTYDDELLLAAAAGHRQKAVTSALSGYRFFSEVTVSRQDSPTNCQIAPKLKKKW